MVHFNRILVYNTKKREVNNRMSNLGNKETMAKNLKYYLEKSGKTQKELSDMLGVATSTFNDWMKAKAYPRIDKIEMLSNYFGILKSDLIEEKTEEHREMHKKNDILSDAIIKMRTDAEFMSVVESLMSLDSEGLAVIKQMASALKK